MAVYKRPTRGTEDWLKKGSCVCVRQREEIEQRCELAVRPDSFAAVGCVQQLAVFTVATWREAY